MRKAALNQKAEQLLSCSASPFLLLFKGLAHVAVPRWVRRTIKAVLRRQ
jgi:hypothetical protein